MWVNGSFNREHFSSISRGTSARSLSLNQFFSLFIFTFPFSWNDIFAILDQPVGKNDDMGSVIKRRKIVKCLVRSMNVLQRKWLCIFDIKIVKCLVRSMNVLQRKWLCIFDIKIVKCLVRSMNVLQRKWLCIFDITNRESVVKSHHLFCAFLERRSEKTWNWIYKISNHCADFSAMIADLLSATDWRLVSAKWRLISDFGHVNPNVHSQCEVALIVARFHTFRNQDPFTVHSRPITVSTASDRGVITMSVDENTEVTTQVTARLTLKDESSTIFFFQEPKTKPLYCRSEENTEAITQDWT
jgi:hypothetical protein